MQADVIVGGLAVLLSGLVVLIPVFGLTLRFAIKPFFDTWAEIQRSRIGQDNRSLQARQLDVLEAELQQVQSMLRSVVEAQEFQRQLADPSYAAGSSDHEVAGRFTAPGPV
jgi:hypothetical protein